MAMLDDAHDIAPDAHAVHTPAADLYCDDGHAALHAPLEPRHSNVSVYAVADEPLTAR